MLLSLIVPCYNEEESIPLFYTEVSKILKGIDADTEIIFVNDGSSDNTLNAIRNIAAVDTRVKYLSFSRNFGKESAMYAGFCNAHGDYTAVMDADLQDPPALLPQMLEILKSGDYDSVATRRYTRDGEPPVRSFFARRFYSLMGHISDTDIVDGARDYRLMSRDMVDAIVAMSEYNRFSKGIFGWIGFRTYWLPYENVERVAGTTKWSFWKLMKYAIGGIINFSNAPLYIASGLGLIMTFIAFIAVIFIIIRKMIFGDPVAGWASTVCIMLFIGGIQLFCIGIIGQYLSRTYMETKNRPHYIVSNTNMDDAKKIK